MGRKWVVTLMLALVGGGRCGQGVQAQEREWVGKSVNFGHGRLDLSLCGWRAANGWWYDCKRGDATHVGKIDADGIKYLEPKTRGRGNDWVLVLDNAAKSYGPPGE
jgi:hypothetical protein